MLGPSDYASLQGLAFVARRMVQGLFGGAHASPYSGSGAEFFDYRSYSSGDEIRQLDWKLFGRTDRLYVRQYQHLTDLRVYLLVDCTASMNFAAIGARGKGQEPITKLQYAATLAAAIAFLTVRQSDRVGLGVYADKLVRHLPTGGTWSHFQRLCRVLEQVQPILGRGNLGASLRHAHSLMKRRGLIVLISDLLDEPHELFDGLNRLRHDGFEVIVFQVLTPQELDLAAAGPLRLRLVDAETRRQVRTHLPQVQRRYAQLMHEHLEAVRRGCVGRGADYNLLITDAGPGPGVIEALRRYLARRTAIRR
ncbi:MAG: DUF58 domain-containing protein [Phycisphaeraceae bacterium]